MQNKNAMVYALDPDQQGKIVWQLRIGMGSAGAVWGPAIDPENHLYAALADGRLGGGLVALDLRNGDKLWSVPAVPCGEKNSAARSRMPPSRRFPASSFRVLSTAIYEPIR